MPKTVWATFRQEKVELLEQMDILDGARILVTILPDEEDKFWFDASQVSLDAIWNNEEDDVYAQLLQKWHPQNRELIQEWQELLKSVELVKIQEQPLVEWYTKKK